MERQQDYGLKAHHGNGMIVRPRATGDRIVDKLHESWFREDARFELTQDENRKYAWMERYFNENPSAMDEYIRWGIQEMRGEDD